MLQNRSIRQTALIVGAFGASLASIWFMKMLIYSEFTVQKVEHKKQREFLPIVQERDIARRTRVEKPVPVTAPEVTKLNIDDSLSVAVESPKIDIAKLDFALDTGVSLPDFGGFASRNIAPLSGMPPNYPRRAQIQKIEGTVELEFTITDTGIVEDIVVLSSTNGDYFIDSAITALKRWRFKPKLEAGKPVSQRAIQTFEFKLEK